MFASRSSGNPRFFFFNILTSRLFQVCWNQLRNFFTIIFIFILSRQLVHGVLFPIYTMDKTFVIIFTMTKIQTDKMLEMNVEIKVVRLLHLQHFPLKQNLKLCRLVRFFFYLFFFWCGWDNKNYYSTKIHCQLIWNFYIFHDPVPSVLFCRLPK